MIILKCRRCKGTGMIPNEQFEVYRALQNDDTKRYFHMQTEDPTDTEEEEIGNDMIPEEIPCPDCNGTGTLIFDEDSWELHLVNETAGEDAQSIRHPDA